MSQWREQLHRQLVRMRPRFKRLAGRLCRDLGIGEAEALPIIDAAVTDFTEEVIACGGDPIGELEKLNCNDLGEFRKPWERKLANAKRRYSRPKQTIKKHEVNGWAIMPESNGRAARSDYPDHVREFLDQAIKGLDGHKRVLAEYFSQERTKAAPGCTGQLTKKGICKALGWSDNRWKDEVISLLTHLHQEIKRRVKEREQPSSQTTRDAS